MDDIAFSAAIVEKKAEQRKVERRKEEKLKADLRHHSVSIRRAHDEPRRDLALEQLAHFARQIESDLM